MKVQEVVSSNISKVGYLPTKGLIVEYKSGNTYAYKDVPYEIYTKMLESESKGRFMNENIKGKYKYSKLEEVL